MKDQPLRLIPCEACDGTGIHGGKGLIEAIDLTSEPDFYGCKWDDCHECRGRGYMSYDELMTYRKKREEEWENGWGKLFKHRIQEDVEEFAKKYADEVNMND